MTYAFKRISYADQLLRLEKAADWLKQIGLRLDDTRFSELLKINRLIVGHQNNDALDILVNEIGNLKLWYALTEASSFIQIYEGFKKEKSHIHRRSKLKKMLGGPFLSWNEKQEENNIESRNTLFELETATQIKQAGAKVVGFDDVDFTFMGTKFNVQCKRVHSKRNIKYNIERAADQFKRKWKQKENIKGIISLSIDKVLDKEKMILKVKSPYEISPILDNMLRNFISKYGNIWHSFLNIDILGVLLFVHIVAIIEEEPHDILTSCREIAFDLLPRQTYFQMSDYYLIKKLGIRLQRNI